MRSVFLFVIATSARGTTHIDRRTDAARLFQQCRTAAVLRRNRQRISPILEAGGDDDDHLRRAVDGDVLLVELRFRATADGCQGDTHRGVVACDLEACATDEGVAARCDGAVRHARVAVLDFEDVHHVRLLAQDFDLRLLDGLAKLSPLGEQYIDRVLKLLKTVKHEGYYAKMAVAWAYSFCFIKFFEKTKNEFESFDKNNIDKFIYNKSIQKSIESYRLTNEQKNILKSMKI